MIQEDKELLLKDLCSRLNTKLVCSIYRTDDQGIGYRDVILHGYCKGDAWYEFYFGEDCGISVDNVSKIKPYLFPLSSITEEQKMFLKQQNWCIAISTSRTVETTIEGIDWLNKNHFDYRGLIEKEFAIDATGLNIY